MLVNVILFYFYFTISAGFSFDPVEGNATVGIPFTLTWHRQQNDSQEFQFERKDIFQQFGNEELIPFTPPDNGTIDGMVTVSFPTLGQYIIEVIVDKSLLIAASQQIFANNPDPLSTVTTRTTSTTRDAQSMSQTSSEFLDLPSTNSNQNASSSAGSRSKAPEIVGATVGSFIFLLLLLSALVYTFHRRQHHNKNRATFHCDRMVRKRSNASFSPFTITTKHLNTYTNFANTEKRDSGSSIQTEDTATRPEPKKECSEYSLPAMPGNRSENLPPLPAHTDRQMELHDVLVKQKIELIGLKTELRRGGDVQAEIDALKAGITGLEEALDSPWALGHTDNTPIEVSRVMDSM